LRNAILFFGAVAFGSGPGPVARIASLTIAGCVTFGDHVMMHYEVLISRMTTLLFLFIGSNVVELELVLVLARGDNTNPVA